MGGERGEVWRVVSQVYAVGSLMHHTVLTLGYAKMSLSPYSVWVNSLVALVQ